MKPSKYAVSGELLVASRLLEYGVNVAFPANPSARYDLITEHRGLLNRVQIKTSIIKRSSGSYAFCVKRRNGRIRASYSKADVDYFALLIVRLSAVYLIPISVLRGRKSITLCPEEKFWIAYKENYDQLKKPYEKRQTPANRRRHPCLPNSV